MAAAVATLVAMEAKVAASVTVGAAAVRAVTTGVEARVGGTVVLVAMADVADAAAGTAGVM